MKRMTKVRYKRKIMKRQIGGETEGKGKENQRSVLMRFEWREKERSEEVKEMGDKTRETERNEEITMKEMSV